MWPQPGGILQWVEAELGRQLQGRRRLQRLGATSPRHPERIGSPPLGGEGPGTQTQAPDAGTQAPGVDLRASGVCRALGAHPGRRELRDGGSAASAGAHQAPEGRAPERRAGGRCGQWAARPVSRGTTAAPSAFPRPGRSHVAPTDRGTGEQPGREHLGGKGDQLGGAQPAFICRWEDPLAARFALRKPKLRVGPAARLGGDGAGTQLRPCP